jgi:hypothetical protein
MCTRRERCDGIPHSLSAKMGSSPIARLSKCLEPRADEKTEKAHSEAAIALKGFNDRFV